MSMLDVSHGENGGVVTSLLVFLSFLTSSVTNYDMLTLATKLMGVCDITGFRCYIFQVHDVANKSICNYFFQWNGSICMSIHPLSVLLVSLCGH